MKEIRFWIDDQEVHAKEGLTILEAATQLGVTIPSLCSHPSLKPSGSCRLCAVEIEGYRGLPAACTTPVAEDMRVQTSTSKVRDFRREMLRLILQEHPRECLGCSRSGTCELQQLVTAVGIDFPYAPPAEGRPPAKPGGGYFERDYSLCVHCGRCVRVCHEVRGAKAIVFREIKGRQEVSTPFDGSLEDAGCQFCGACVDVCPVGALHEVMDHQQSEQHLQMQDSCAYLTDIVMSLYRREQPRKSTTSVCPVCSAGCRLTVEVNEANEIVRAKPSPLGPTNRGQACVQGRFLLKGRLNGPDRLQQPLVKENGAYAEKDWAAVLDAIAGKLKGYAPGEVGVLTDARVTNEELYLLQKFARTVLKTDAVGVLAPQGHRPASKVLWEELGCAASTGSMADLKQAGAILAIGFASAGSHPIMGTAVRDAVLSGAKLIVANPCTSSMVRYGDVHLPYTPGTELPLLMGLLRVMIDEKQIDPDFASQYPKELEEMKAALKDYDLGRVSGITGVSQEMLSEAACMLGKGSTVAVLYGLGLIESPVAAEAVRTMVTLLHLKGSFGKAGGGIYPAYGASNTQGAWDMGMAYCLLPGQVDRLDEKEGSRFAKAWGVELPATPAEGIFKQLAAGKIRALYLAMETIGESLLEEIKPYLGKLDFVVVQDIISPEQGMKADIILPMASLLEKEGTITNGERRVQGVVPALSAPANARSVQWVLSELARRMGAPGFEMDGAGAVLSEISRLVPAYAGVTLESVRGTSPQWPCGNGAPAGTATLFADGKPAWTRRKPESQKASEVTRSDDYPFAVVSKERLQPFYLGPLMAPESVAAVKLPEDAIQMGPSDFYGMELKEGDEVRLIHSMGESVGPVVLNRLLPPKMIVAPAGMGRKVISGLNLSITVSFARVEKR